jgi:DNA-binding LacI/PurR family transcriptional regulator
MGAAAAAMLLDAINDRGELGNVLMTPNLVVRRTTGPAPAD